MQEKSKILVVDDEPGMRTFLEIILRKEGYSVETAADGMKALDNINNNVFDLAILDILMPVMNGIEVLKRIIEKSPETTVIIITAFASHETAIEAMKLGAYDYITKPFKIDEIKLVIKKALDKKGLERENLRLRKELQTKYGFANIIGRSIGISKVFELIKRVSELKVNVLITGESGTGKELVARAVHYSGSRHRGPFIAVNCGAIPEPLVESELFGYRRGAFTGASRNKKGLFEEADGGTIFLDEIVDLPIHLQVKLLRVIEEKTIRPLGSTEPIPVDIRIIAATNKLLEEEIANEKFREDLFYRLNVIKIDLPPLRDRRDDIPPLAIHFVEKYSREMGKDINGISPKALETLESYHYPGNVRELENIIARCVALETSNVIRQQTLPELMVNMGSLNIENGIAGNFGLDHLLETFEKRTIDKALTEAQGNKVEAAKLLGITFRSLRYRLAKHGLLDEEEEGADDKENM
ncbi:MAG: sigma-54-dependent Fis family transcriptional regulator [Candidatus Dadabacteria bacterium]|nr:sigma-54-dependent Fis family transcriptional regulator [Candidatus Dadabacteria bacterium]